MNQELKLDFSFGDVGESVNPLVFDTRDCKRTSYRPL